MIIGTAGHVDHGKTTLIHALTGTDCDQLAEEKRRGITIALGFARWRLPEPVSVVDVPGHERLVQTMLSGAGGIDGVLLALSGLAGVMPQTREHLAACALLGVRWGVVALTFADKVPDLDAAIRRARADLRGSLLAEAPIIPVSAVTGLGLDALREATRAALLAHPRPPSLGLARLPVDRVFSVSGAGTVVTGSLLDGRIFVGDTLSVTPSGAMARVRGLEVHGAAVEAVEAGQRVALSLSLKRDQITRGAILSAPGLVGVGAVFDAALRWCAHAPRPLSRQGGLVLHAYGAKAAVEIRADAPIEPGGEGVGRLRLSHPIPLLPGGRFVLRGDPDHAHGAVIGGGVILDTAPPKRRAPLIRARLWSAPEAAPTLLLREAGRGGLEGAAIPRRLGLRAPWRGLRFHPEVIAAEAAALVTSVTAHHAAHPQALGAPRPEPTTLARLAEAEAIAEGALLRAGPLLRRPEHAPVIPRADKQLAYKLIRALGGRGLAGATPRDLAQRLQRTERDVLRCLRLLEARQRLILSEGVCLPIEEAEAAREALLYHLSTEAPLTVSEARARLGVSRAVALALLAWLDQEGLTRRVGGARVRRAEADFGVSPLRPK